MTDIITGPGSYVTVDGRRVEVKWSSNSRCWVTTNLNTMKHDGTRHVSAPQVYYPDGRVAVEQPGEENDRIVGPWIAPTSPVRLVQQLVAGTYGIVEFHLPNGPDFTSDGWKTHVRVMADNPSAEELRAAAQTLTEIAEFIG